MGKTRGLGSIYKPKRSANLLIQYYRNGRPFRESSGSPSRKVAAKLLKQRIGELANGNFIEPTDRRVTVDELYDSLLADYRNNEMASLENTELRWKRLKLKFSGVRAVNVTTPSLDAYVELVP